MPRLVDHAERRRSIIETTWRLIAEHGIDALNLRDLARECGYAGPGVLSHYFDGKDALLLASYRLICERTQERIDAGVAGRRGLDALRRMCDEIIPADPLTVLEARVAVAFWQRAQTSDALRQVARDALREWRDDMIGFLREAIDDGELAADAVPADTTDALVNLMMGLHITTMLDPELGPPGRQRDLVASLIERDRVGEVIRADRTTSPERSGG